jgi:hypothetical protein
MHLYFTTTQTEKFNFCLFKKMMMMIIITKKIGTLLKIQISLIPAAFKWKTFSDILYAELYAKKTVYAGAMHSDVPKCLKRLLQS